MKIILYVLIGLHGFIHLFGFLKAFNINEFEALTQPIAKPVGVLWFVSFVFFGLTLFLLIKNNSFWWLAGIAAVVISQILIFLFWQDAKFGSLPNLIILISCILGWASYSFTKKVKQETETMLSKAQVEIESYPDQNFKHLPAPVQQWLEKSGINEKTKTSLVYLKQAIKMKMKPEQEEWTNATAQQYFTVNPPAFNWFVILKMNPFLNLVGRDKLENGQGEMIIKMFSLFSIANAKNDEKISQATLQRYLGEMVWFPSAALASYIVWEEINDTSAKATITCNGTKGSGIFHFDENGNFKKFEAMRYKDSKDPEPKKWTVIATKTEERNGIKIPVECEATWKLENGNWTWLKLKITDINYNI